MIDERIFLLMIPVIFFWILMSASHRSKYIQHKLRLPRILALIAGSKTEWVDKRAYAFQLGDISTILLYVLMMTSNIDYLYTNAFALSIVVGALIALMLQKLL